VFIAQFTTDHRKTSTNDSKIIPSLLLQVKMNVRKRFSIS